MESFSHRRASRFQLRRLIFLMMPILSVTLVKAEPVQIMPLGDSITRGLANTGWIPGGYRTRLYQRLTTEVFPTRGVDFVGTQNDNPAPSNLPDPDHEGRGGFRIDQHMPTIGQAVRDHAPAVVLLHLGTNDIDQKYDLANAPARLDSLIGEIVDASPGTYILVAQISNSAPQNAAKTPAIEAFNAALPDIVSARRANGQRVSIVNMFDVVSPENFADTTYHPNKAGYDQMADAWLEAISTLGPLDNPVVPPQPGDSILQTTTIMAGTQTGFPVSNADLINFGSPSLASVQHENYTPYSHNASTSTAAALNDGSAGPDASALGAAAFDLDGTWVSTYRFSTSVAPHGYDVTGIHTISGWEQSRISQSYVLSCAFADAPETFVSYGAFHSLSSPAGSNSMQIALRDPSGVIARGVVAVRFEFRPPAAGAETVYREIDVLGEPTLGVPTIGLEFSGTALHLQLGRLVPGSTVIVERSFTLEAESWEKVEEFQPTMTTATWSDTPTAPSSFYRIRAVR